MSRSANGREELGGMIKAGPRQTAPVEMRHLKRGAGDSRSLFQFDDGQISLAFQVRDDKTQLHAIGAAHFQT